jgi:hypothetical protein
MPPRDSELPEGTDHIISGAMETGARSGSTTASASAGGTTGSGSDSGSFIGGSATGTDDTGGTASGGTKENFKAQVRDQIQTLKGQATDKARQYADQGKDRATTALDDFAQVVQDAAKSVDDRLGSEYGQYAHRAADAVTQLADGLRGKSVDDLLEDSRALVRKSPGVAIGAAALVGFVLARVVKAGMPSDDRDVDFRPDPALTDQTGKSGTGV